MSRFVVVSFAFLGWGFYEISGGQDFAPPERPVEHASKSLPLATPEPAYNPAAATAKFQRSAKLRAASQVHAQHSETTAPARPAANPAQRRAVALAQIASAGATLQESGIAFAGSTTAGGLRLTSIQGGLAAITTDQTQTAGLSGTETVPPEPESYLDIRQIRASRVNMRQGPGTIYPVLTRLLAGDEVLVIEDSGTGWLQLRTQNGNKVGWVAASLVSQKRS
ncbi:SH3 domain-containing protein [Pseudophaeobacter sp.]|uniref:SH3 domain-containing protein n=1 Tax=Pseudophaeobacter sp. TaxID=1971739 RepID=UPI00405A3B11